MKNRRKYWKKKTHTRGKTEYTNKSNIIIKLLKNRKTRENGLKIQSLTHTHATTHFYYRKQNTLRRKQSTRKKKGEKHISVASKKGA